MTKINYFEILNYRSCIKTRVEVNTNLTTLIGINGVGKSNILQSFQLLKKIRRNRYFALQKELLDSLSHSILTIGFDYNEEKYTLKVEVFYETDDRNIDEIFTATIQIKHNSDTNSKRIRWQDVDIDLLEVVDRSRHMGRSVRQLNLFGTHLSKDTLNVAIFLLEYINNISYYGATVFSDPSKCPISLELEDTRPLRNLRNSKPHDKFMHDLYLTYKNHNKNFQKYLNTVNKIGIGIVDDIKFYEHNMPSSSYEIKSGGKLKQIERTKNIIIPSFIIDELNLSPNQLSEGTFKTLALVFYILNDDSELLIIEEPEVCIHHGLLSSIIELIKIQSKHKQIFISTHSDFVLDQLEPENIVLVRKDLNSGTIATSLTKSLKKNDYAALKEYLANSGNLGEYWKEGGFENG